MTRTQETKLRAGGEVRCTTREQADRLATAFQSKHSITVTVWDVIEVKTNQRSVVVQG